MNHIVLLIGCGGFLGSIARYECQQWALKALPANYPYGTFIVNILGSFLIGAIYAAAGKGGWLNAEWRFFLATGVCGGFTTFSSFSYEALTLLKEGNYFSFGLYAVLSVVLGLLAAFLGMEAVKQFT